MKRLAAVFFSLMLLFAPAVQTVPTAFAGEEWCDIDPPVVIVTPQGHLATVYANIGSQGLLPSLLNELSQISYTVAPANGGTATQVTLTVTVRKTLLTGSSTPTRVKVSSLLLGLGNVYGSANGTVGKPMTVKFLINTP
jgi:hypothetical protein